MSILRLRTFMSAGTVPTLIFSICKEYRYMSLTIICCFSLIVHKYQTPVSYGKNSGRFRGLQEPLWKYACYHMQLRSGWVGDTLQLVDPELVVSLSLNADKCIISFRNAQFVNCWDLLLLSAFKILLDLSLGKGTSAIVQYFFAVY